MEEVLGSDPGDQVDLRRCNFELNIIGSSSLRVGIRIIKRCKSIDHLIVVFVDERAHFLGADKEGIEAGAVGTIPDRLTQGVSQRRKRHRDRGDMKVSQRHRQALRYTQRPRLP